MLSKAKGFEKTRRLTEKGIVQGNGVNLAHIRIPQELRINVEEDRHIDRLALIQSLLLEAKTLNLAKVGGDLPRRDRVSGDAYDVLVLAVVGGRVKSQCRLAGQHAHFALLRSEFPG